MGSQAHETWKVRRDSSGKKAAHGGGVPGEAPAADQRLQLASPSVALPGYSTCAGVGEGRAGYGWTGVSVGEGLGREPVSEFWEQGLGDDLRGVVVSFGV